MLPPYSQQAPKTPYCTRMLAANSVFANPEKSKRAALAKGREVAAILTRYHQLLRTRTLLGDVLGADGLSDGMLAAVIAPLRIRDDPP